MMEVLSGANGTDSELRTTQAAAATTDPRSATHTSPGRPGNVKAVHSGRRRKHSDGVTSPHDSAKRKKGASEQSASSTSPQLSGSSVRFKSKSGPVKKNPWSVATAQPRKPKARFPSVTSVAITPSGPKVQTKPNVQARIPDLEADISTLGALDTVKVRVDSWTTYLTLSDYEGLRPGAWVTGTVIDLLGHHTLRSFQNKRRTGSALGTQSQQTFLSGPSLYMSPWTSSMMKARTNVWFQHVVSITHFDCIICVFIIRRAC